MAKADLSAERLREVLEYNSETGEFFWKIKKLRSQVGDKAGGLNAAGYIQIVVDGFNYYGHRLAWLYTHGRWPSGMMDHMNGNRADNRIANLREVSGRVNCENRRAPQSNKINGSSLGVSRTQSKTNPWFASIRVNGETVHLGRHPTEEAASAAYLAAKRRLHEGCTI